MPLKTAEIAELKHCRKCYPFTFIPTLCVICYPSRQIPLKGFAFCEEALHLGSGGFGAV